MRPSTHPALAPASRLSVRRHGRLLAKPMLAAMASEGPVQGSRNTRGMTLLEVMFAVGILTVAFGGILASFMQSRRLTEGSVYQNAALTIVQGYVEQIKNMDINQMVGGSDSSGNPVLNTASYSISVRLAP